MAMISGGDESARNAFRAILRDDSSQHPILTTQEIDAADVLEVRNLADAIARAEEVLRAESSRPKSGRDMFAELGGATDDISGPAVYAAARPTPLPPAPPSGTAPVPAVAAQPPVLLVPTEEDAFLQPAGRIRTLADETLDGYRPEPTLELRIRARRRTASWMVAALLGILLVLVAAAGAMSMQAPEAQVPTAAPPAAKPEAKPLPAEPAPEPAAVTETKPTTPVPSMPVMDVNRLPTARPTR